MTNIFILRFNLYSYLLGSRKQNYLETILPIWVQINTFTNLCSFFTGTNYLDKNYKVIRGVQS